MCSEFEPTLALDGITWSQGAMGRETQAKQERLPHPVPQEPMPSAWTVEHMQCVFFLPQTRTMLPFETVGSTAV
jgi:hypothetical protein